MFFKAYKFVLLTLVCGTFSYDFYDFPDLGQQIRENVQRQLAPLQNLGPRISALVEESLRPLRDGKLHSSAIYPNINLRLGLDPLGQQNVLQDTVYRSLPNENLHNTIQQNVNNQLSGLDTLGQQIQQNVNQQLEPVRAMVIKLKMKQGVGGVTIATYLPGGKKFLIRNKQTFTCSGSISDTGECRGNLILFQTKDKKDYCYKLDGGYSMVNNKICIGANSVTIINNVIKCESYDGTPHLETTVEEFKKLCEGEAKTVEYKYIANVKDPMHVEIPNKNKYVQCNNNEPEICTFTDTFDFI